MQDDDGSSAKPPDNEDPSQSPSSYVYPVKSLLSGIQPAPPTQSSPSVPRSNASQAGDFVALQDLLTHQLADARRKSGAGLDMIAPHPAPLRSHSMSYPYPSTTAIAGPSDMSEEHCRTASDPFSPRMQPAGGQSSRPIPFTEDTFSPTTSQPFASGSPGPLELDLPAPSDSPSDTSPAPSHPSDDKVLASSESEPLSDPMTEHLMSEEGRASPTHSVDSHISHISQSGIVHLPGFPSASGSSRACSRGSDSQTHSSSRKYFPSANSNTSSQRMHRVPEAQEEARASDASSRSSSNRKSAGPNTEGDLLTTRYRHDTDENGNNVVIGREGDIRRCEDEVCISQCRPRNSCPSHILQPIRTPGAIQGFGVMVVVAEDAHAGTLTVRQVSEVPSPKRLRCVCTSLSPRRIRRTS